MSFLLVAGAALGSCRKEVEPKGLFVLHNQSGHAVTLRVFSTQDRRKAPLTLSLPNGQQVERTAYGGAGAIAYSELFFQGDSVQWSFSDGKQLVHHCTQAQQLSGQCSPAVHNILSLQEYAQEPLGEGYDRYTYTYTLTQADYATAR
ncbi:hypothetical protein GCM10022408_32720 [Hymenobacter fastidiosus]|uniref:C-type lysozyme inhibitor domain-containing protein n=2 Tax=Hymenobacter fastidiosus TaxID=486264 RepID=A0ABP7SV80_9BACT